MFQDNDSFVVPCQDCKCFSKISIKSYNLWEYKVIYHGSSKDVASMNIFPIFSSLYSILCLKTFKFMICILKYVVSSFLKGGRGSVPVKLPHESFFVTSFDFSEQCHNLVSGVYKTSCKTGEGLEDMFNDIAFQLINSNRSRIELQSMEQHGFRITNYEEESLEDNCLC